MVSETEENFVKQLKANQNIVHKICRLYTSDQDAHNDLFQEITIQLWKAFPKFRGESKFSTWAYRVGLNTAITLYRKKKRSIETTPFDSEFHHFQTDEYNFEQEEQFPNHKNPITIEYVDFQKKMIDTLVINDSIKGTALDIITDGMKSNYLTESGFVMVGEVAISFEKK